MPDTVSLKEHLELKISLTKAVTDKELALLETARVLQHGEYARRLEELNHAHELNLARNAEFVRVDKFEGLEKTFQIYKEATQEALTLAAGTKRGQASTFSGINSSAGFILVILLMIGATVTLYNKPTPALPPIVVQMSAPSPAPVLQVAPQSEEKKK